MGAAMQYLQSKGLCLMPLELASMMKKRGAWEGGNVGEGIEREAQEEKGGVKEEVGA